jgi:hypothetical protein
MLCRARACVMLYVRQVVKKLLLLYLYDSSPSDGTASPACLARFAVRPRPCLELALAVASWLQSERRKERKTYIRSPGVRKGGTHQ